MDDHEAMYAAGRARRNSSAAPKGGGYSNGGRVAKRAYATGGVVDTLDDGRGRAKPFTTVEAASKGPQPGETRVGSAETASSSRGTIGRMEEGLPRRAEEGYASGGRVKGGSGHPPAPVANPGPIAGGDRRLAAQTAGHPIARKSGGRVGKGC